jgi:spore coat-associated protein N
MIQTASPSLADEAPPENTGRKVVGIAAIVVLLLAMLGATSLALFTDQETIPNNTFQTGTVDLTVSPSTALVTTTPIMAPGDTFTAPLTVTNSGTLGLRYAMASVTTENVLAGELVMTIKTGVTTCDDASWAADGTSIYTGVLGTMGGTDVLGDNATGAQAGDRTLAAAANEVLCFNVTLPINATNASQGVTSTATFTFDAEQTANN